MARTWMDMHRLRRLHDSQYIMKNPFTNENSNLSNIFHNNIHRKKVESLKVRSTEEFLCQFAWLPCRFFRGRRQGRQPLNMFGLFFRAKFQGISPQFIWPKICYSTFILGSWRSPIDFKLRKSGKWEMFQQVTFDSRGFKRCWKMVINNVAGMHIQVGATNNCIPSCIICPLFSFWLHPFHSAWNPYWSPKKMGSTSTKKGGYGTNKSRSPTKLSCLSRVSKHSS